MNNAKWVPVKFLRKVVVGAKQQRTGDVVKVRKSVFG